MVSPVIEVLLPVLEAPLLVCVAVVPPLFPTGALLMEPEVPWSEVLPVAPVVPVALVEPVELAPVPAPVPEVVPDPVPPVCALATPKQRNKAAVIPNVRMY